MNISTLLNGFNVQVNSFKNAVFPKGGVCLKLHIRLMEGK